MPPTEDSEEYLKTTPFEDFKFAVYDTRYSAPLVILFALLLSYQLTVAPYQTHYHKDSNKNSLSNRVEDLSLIRPIIPSNDQVNIQKILLEAETEVSLPEPIYDHIKFKFFTSVDKFGNKKLPKMFYEGVTFGITSDNSHKLEYTAQNEYSLKDLKHDIVHMKPSPTHIMERLSLNQMIIIPNYLTAHSHYRSATCNHTYWNELGYAVYFSYDDLSRQGKLSSDPLQPWKRVNEEMMLLARKHKQVYITLWYPKAFGEKLNPKTIKKVEPRSLLQTQEESRNEIFNDEYRHQVIIQQILPTRTGLNELKSLATVWLSAVNRTNVENKSYLYRKDWTDEELLEYRRNRRLSKEFQNIEEL